MILNYKYRLKDRRIRNTLLAQASAVNQVWNFCNNIQKTVERRYKAGAPARRWHSNFDLITLSKGAAKELGIHAQTVQCVCKQFVKSRNKAQRSLRFRSSIGSNRSLGWIPFQKQSRQIAGNSVCYLGTRIRFFGFNRRPLPSVVKSGCFVEDSQGRWYVCFNVEVNDISTLNTDAVGIDLGLKSFATLSTGAKISALQCFRKHKTRLAIAQRAKNKKRVKAIHTKIKNIRQDYLHKLSFKLVKANGTIVVGNISASKLGRTRMAKSVYDAGWSMFRNQLRYKARRHGVEYMEVDERFTSQRCSRCGEIPDSSPKGMGAVGIREWVCSSCGESHDRDVNAARNILILGLSTQPRVDESREIING